MVFEYYLGMSHPLRPFLFFVLVLSLVIPSPALYAQQGVSTAGAVSAGVEAGTETAAQSALRATAERAFLTDLRERVKDFMDINLQYVANLEHCLKGERTTLNCDREKAIVKNNILVQYPIMRQLQFLKSLVVGAPDEIMQLYGMQLHALRSGHDRRDTVCPNCPGPHFSLNRWISLRHPLDGLVSAEHFELAARDMTDAEAEYVLSGDSPVIEGTLYPANLNGYMRWFCELAYGENRPDCENLQFGYSRTDGQVYFIFPSPQAIHGASASVPSYLDPVFQARTSHVRRQAAEQLLNTYYKVVQENPYVALVSGELYAALAQTNPTAADRNLIQEELVRIFTFVRQQAQEALRVYEKKLVDLRDPRATNADLREVLSYASIAEALVDEPGENMTLVPYDYAEVLQQSSQEHASYELKKAMAWIVGSIAVCWGGGKIFKLAAEGQKLLRMEAKGVNFLRRSQNLTRPEKWAEFFSPFCWGMTAVPLNIYFLGEAVASYRSTYRELFSNSNKGSDLHQLHELSDAKRGVFWSLVLLPLGYQETVKALRASGIYVSKTLDAQIMKLKSR